MGNSSSICADKNATKHYDVTLVYIRFIKNSKNIILLRKKNIKMYNYASGKNNLFEKKG